MRAKLTGLAAGFIVLATAGSGLAQDGQANATASAPQTTATAPAEPAGDKPRELTTSPLVPQILAAPTNRKEIDQRIELIDAELAALQATSQPTTAPTTAPADPMAAARAELAAKLTDYRSFLGYWVRWQDEIATFKNPEDIAKFSAELEALDRQRKEYVSRQTEDIRYVWQSTLEQVEKEYATRNNDLLELRSFQVTREQMIADLPKQRAENEAALVRTLEAMQAYIGELPSKMVSAQDRDQRQALLLRKRVLEWAHNIELLRAASLGDLGTRLNLQQQRTKDRLAALTPLTEALHAYLARLQGIRTQSDVEFAQQQVALAGLTPYERAYYEVVLATARGMAFFQKIDTDTKGMLTQADLDKLKQRAARGLSYWESFMESVDRRPGEAILIAYQRLGERLSDDQAALTDLQGKYDTINDQLRTAQDRRDAIFEEVDALRTQLDEQIQRISGDEQVKARQLQARLTTEERPRLEEKANTRVTELAALRDRLREGIAILKDAISKRQRYRSQMYRAHLLVPEPRLLRGDFSGIRQEWRSLVTGEGEASRDWRAWVAAVREHAAAVTVGAWVSTGLLVLLTVILAAISRSRLWAWAEDRQHGYERQAGVGQESEADDSVATSSDQPVVGATVLASFAHRVHIQTLLMIVRTALMAWPVAMLLVGVLIFRVTGAMFNVVTGGLIVVLLAIGGSALITALFDAARPAWRIIHCSEPVAAYHRRWLRSLFWLAVLTLPVPAALQELGLLPEIREFWWALSLGAILLLLFIYQVRRSKFFPGHTAQRAEDDWRLAFAYRFFPLLPALTAILLVLHLIGYAALVDFLVRGLALTTGILLAARFVRGMLVALVPARTMREEAKAEARIDAQVGTHPFVALAFSVLRAVVLLGALLGVLIVWGISTGEVQEWFNKPLMTTGSGPITTWRLLGAVLVVAGGVFVSRTLRAFLNREVFPKTATFDRGTQAAIVMLLHYSVLAMAVYISLNVVNINLAALTILVGTLGLGLGLGLQPFFVNFISGLMILLERQIKVGDIIEIDGKLGEVLTISMRSTKIRSFDNVELVIPNGDFVTGRVTNWTLTDPKVRGRIEVGVAYGSDVELVRKLLLDVAHRHPDVLVDPMPAVWFTNFGASSLDFVLACWFANTSTRWNFLSQVRFEVDRLFREHGITIPFPQQTLSFLGDKPLPVEIRMSSPIPGEDNPAKDALSQEAKNIKEQ